MNKIRLTALALILSGALIGFFVYYSEINSDSSLYRPFKLGLDLSGGSQLVYQADVSNLNSADVSGAMNSLREVIERRINVFGVSEPIVQVEYSPLAEGSPHRLIVSLPGVTDVKQATEMISATPVLEFKTERPDGAEKEAIVSAVNEINDFIKAQAGEIKDMATLDSLLANNFSAETLELSKQDPYFVASGLTGRYLKKAQVSFSQNSISPSISLEFNNEGADMFAEITKNNVGKPVAIYLDGAIISAPEVQEEIRDGQAEISGQFTVQEAKELVRNLNLGALPVPITLASVQTVGATLGIEALEKGIFAGLIGLLLIAVFMILWYRLPGLVAILALAIYVILVLAVFKLIPVTLTAAGIAGFILSIGLAVDANVLIFERTKEELAKGKTVHDAVSEGFSRAWLSIRDSNLSSIISATVLFWFGTSLIKGFALTLSIGILVSMFTALTVSRTLLLALGFRKNNNFTKFMFGGGFFKN